MDNTAQVPSWLKWLGVGVGSTIAVSQIPKIIRGIVAGVIMIVIAFMATFASVTGVAENSKDVAALSLVAAGEVSATTRGVIKAYGKLRTEMPLSIKLSKCADSACASASFLDTYTQGDLLYYKVSYERFQVVETEERKTENGETVVTKGYKEDWVALDSEEMWATGIKFGQLEVKPAKSSVRIDSVSETTTDLFRKELPVLNNYGRAVSAEVGKLRATISYIPQDEREYIVVGEVRSGVIDSGEVFIVTDDSERELVGSLAAQESSSRWLLRIVAFVMLTLGLTSILSPVLAFTDLIPVVGSAARGLAGLVSAAIAVIIIFLTTIIIQFWWVLFIILVIGLIAFLYSSFHARKSK
jgi:hypothetical protein